ncbi:MAG TPA: DUF4397 domain-containing protein [Gemmatimonadaceae bacterium]
MNSYSKVSPWRHVRHGALAMAVAAAAACGTKEAPGPLEPTGPTGRIRFVNLITDPARNPVNAILEKVPFGVNLGYTGTTPSSLPAPNTANYSAILAGDRSLVLKRTADTTVTVATLTVTITSGQDVSVYATGGAGGGAVSSFVTKDTNTAATSTQTRVRVVNLSPSAGSIDVFITAPNADLSTATPVASGVATQSASAYVTTIAPGTYQFRAVPAGTAPANRSANVLVNIASVALAGTSGRTFVVADKAAGGTPSTAFVLSDQ